MVGWLRAIRQQVHFPITPKPGGKTVTRASSGLEEHEVSYPYLDPIGEISGKGLELRNSHNTYYSKMSNSSNQHEGHDEKRDMMTKTWPGWKPLPAFDEVELR